MSELVGTCEIVSATGDVSSSETGGVSEAPPSDKPSAASSNKGAIIGGVVGGVAVLVICAILLFFLAIGALSFRMQLLDLSAQIHVCTMRRDLAPSLALTGH
jgi:predicted lipid-binding transport protein (Tim44 family)